MKYRIMNFAAALVMFSLVSAHSQPGGMGGPPRGPDLSGAMAKLFGENSAFSANMEMQMTGGASSGTMTVPGKMYSDAGKSRFEVQITDIQGGQMPPQAAEQMKAMGMDKMVNISLPDKKKLYLVYPSLQGYVEMPIPNSNGASSPSDFKVDLTELGKETVDGHPCVKSKAVVTDKQGTKHESIIWSATDLNKFPIKIETTEQGHKITMLFKNVKLAKPDSTLFEPPADFKKYDSMMSLMMQRAMPGMGQGGMMGPPPGMRPPQGE